MKSVVGNGEERRGVGKYIIYIWERVNGAGMRGTGKMVRKEEVLGGIGESGKGSGCVKGMGQRLKGKRDSG